MKVETARGVAKLLEGRPALWFQALMMHWANPDMPQQELGLACGYDPKHARKTVSRLLREIPMQKALALLRADLAEQTGVTREWWTRTQRAVVERCMQAEMVVDADGGTTGEYKFDAAGANAGLNNLAKAEGFYRPIEVNHRGVKFLQVLTSADD